MSVLHGLLAVLLLVLTIFLVTEVALRDGRRDSSRVVPITGFLALILATVLFTGFFQLGSVNSIPDTVLVKLAGTFTGGFISLVGAFLYVKEALGEPVFYGFQAVSIAIYCYNFYLAVGF